MSEVLISRRVAIAGAGALALAGCATGQSIETGAGVDANVDNAVALLYQRMPYARQIADRAAGMLVMPSIVKGGFVVGGAYGEGALRLAGDGFRQTADYYSFAAASIGYQAGLQKTSHALFFMTPGSLNRFRNSKNFEVGADAEVTVLDTGVKADLNTTVAQQPIIALVFSQAGLMAGASLEGAKYTKIQI